MARHQRMDPITIAPKYATAREAAAPPVAKRSGVLPTAITQSLEAASVPPLEPKQPEPEQPKRLGEVIAEVVAKMHAQAEDETRDPLEPDPLASDPLIDDVSDAVIGPAR